ncbi:type II toxin-antitoxin system VapC family toxin [Microbacterium thalassium]|uniref:Ribonuclease VapC n=1 Tax=Microbacterium thalassium TaxID=362649 RepID=A0A7X0FS41_9MICO|nr:type II toxin-antitoxin system VapC family toxin [Microbacterium thalassium]MBB6392679.1 putative nucleic acid-binding protein [Microbacterium thalassium]GLK23090.1 hypothetical protein GCM10017607_04080 [Microbacterium thalassium]
MPDADRPELVVVDASVVVALVAAPNATVDALAARLRETSLHAPQHLPVEVDSALRGLVLGGVLSPAQGGAARRVARELPVDLWPWEILSDRAWELRDNLTTYDAGYVALAEHLGAALVTADARIATVPHVTCPVEVLD